MYEESSSDFDDLPSYRCPKCSRCPSSLRNLRDYIDDDVTAAFASPIPDAGSRRLGDDPLRRDVLDIERRRLRLAKELELRSRILRRRGAAEFELKSLSDEINRAKQRQYEMCQIIHKDKQEIDKLRQSAEKISANQQIIDRLQRELQDKDEQLEKSSAELRVLADLHHQLQEDFQALNEECKHHRRQLEDIYSKLCQKEQLIAEKQREVESLQIFIKEASKKEIAARKKLEDFINSLLDRTELAEEQVRKLTKQLTIQGIASGAIYKSVSDNQLHLLGSRNIRSQSVDPLLLGSLQRTSDTVQSHIPRQRQEPQYVYNASLPHHVQRPQSQPQYVYSVMPEVGARSLDRSGSRRLPTSPFGKDYRTYPGHSTTSTASGGGVPGCEKVPRPKWQGSDGRSRHDSERPESGYGSVRHGSSRPQSRLSSVSEHSNASTDTVVPASEYQTDCPRRAPSLTGSSILDADDEMFELNLDHKLPVDDNGILWPDDICKQKPRLSADWRRTDGSSWAEDRPNKPQLELSRMSSVTSIERDILTDINQETKFEMQRYKFLLRDRLHLLKEQQKHIERDDDGSSGGDKTDMSSNSDLTSLTSNGSLTSVTFTSISELSDNEHSGRKWKRSKFKSPLTQKDHVKRLVAEKPKPVSIVPQRSVKPLTITPPSGTRARHISVSSASAFHNPSAAVAATKQQQQQQKQQQGKEHLDPATLQRHSLLFLIFNYLDTRTLSRISVVCREWRDISRHPSLWRRVILTNSRISSKFLHTISQWCCNMEILVLEELRARSKKSYESIDEYKKKTRGCLEPGLDDLLKASQQTLVSLRIVDCGNILTERCLWLASCHCHLLQRVTYVSNTDPLGSEVIWSLGAGCREITKFIVPPLYPNERADRFTNRCLQMISWCWPELKILAVGGKYIGKKGLLEIARNCSVLQMLELHQMKKLTDEIALGMCGAGLRHLELLAIIFTRVTPSVIKIFVDSCPRLKSLKIQIGMSDYYSDTENMDNKQAFAAIVKEMECLKKSEAIAKVLSLQVIQ